MTTVRLRAGNEADCDALLGVHHRSILGLGPSAYSQAECASWAAGLSRNQYREAMVGGGETFMVAEANGNLVGFCSFKAAEIVGLYIDPALKRKGIGSLLLKSAEERITAEYATSIMLNAALSALHFYEAQGYRKISRKKWKTRGGLVISIWEMKKDIA